MKPFLTPADVAERLQLPPRTVRRLLVRGFFAGLKIVPVGRRLRIDAESFEQWLEKMSTEYRSDPKVVEKF